MSFNLLANLCKQASNRNNEKTSKNLPKTLIHGEESNEDQQSVLHWYSQGVTKYKVKCVCRICGNYGNIPIFDKTSEQNLITNIKTFANVKIEENDGLPSHICGACLSLLNNALLFKSKCEQTDFQLREKYVKIKQLTRDEEISGKVIKNIDDISSHEPYFSHVNETLNNDFFWPDDDDLPINETNETPASDTKVEHGLIDCEQCDMCFIDKEEYHNHLPLCISCIDKSSAWKYPSTPEKIPFICEFCGRGFMKIISLRAHSLVHSDNLPFQCDHCPYRGRRKNAMRRHMYVHTGERPHMCDKCPKRFTTTGNLHKHTWQHNKDNPKPFKIQCSVCQKGFATNMLKTDHEQSVHFGIRAYMCDICGMSMSTRKTLGKHRSKMHNINVNSEKAPWCRRPPTFMLIEEKKKLEERK